MRKYQAVFVLLIVLLGTSSLPVSAHSSNGNYNLTISVSDKGFFPGSVKIPAGTTVVWVNKGNKLHWPASDLHPTHTRYPGSSIEKCGTSEETSVLDACNGLKADETFKFHFDEAGNWTLHDHINPWLSMKIEVIDYSLKNEEKSSKGLTNGKFIMDRLFNFLSRLSYNNRINQNRPNDEKEAGFLNDSEMALKAFNSCQELRDNKIRCYSKEFKDIAFRHGSEYAFSVLHSLQKIDDAAKVCHVIAHGIGWGTYQREPRNWQEQVAKINPTCVYGAIHGILESYIDDIEGGKLTKELMPRLCQTNPKSTCFHAIGHVAIVEAKDDLHDAIELCYAFPKDGNRKHYCLTGIFMEHMIADNLVEHGVYPIERRLYWYRSFKDFENTCRSQKGENNTACWTEMIHPASIAFRGDPMKVIEYCNNAEAESGRKFCRRHAFVELFPKNNFSINALRWACQIPQPNDTSFERDCYVVLLKSKLLVFSPEESVDVVEFCSTLSDEFKNMCFSKIGETFRERYIDEKKISDLCRKAPLKYQKICAGTSPVKDADSAYINDANEYSDFQKN